MVGRLDPLERVFTVFSEIDCVALMGQAAFDQVGQPGFVFNDENAHETCHMVKGRYDELRAGIVACRERRQ